MSDTDLTGEAGQPLRTEVTTARSIPPAPPGSPAREFIYTNEKSQTDGEICSALLLNLVEQHSHERTVLHGYYTIS